MSYSANLAEDTAGKVSSQFPAKSSDSMQEKPIK
jgi:hypothetical protein